MRNGLDAKGHTVFFRSFGSWLKPANNFEACNDGARKEGKIISRNPRAITHLRQTRMLSLRSQSLQGPTRALACGYFW